MTRQARAPHLRSIRGRVAAVAVVSAASGGLLASGIAIAAVDALIARQLDQRLKAAAVTLADELDEEASHEPDELIATLADENAEIAASGIRMSVLQGHTVIAGDPDVERPEAECESYGSLGNRVRVCAKAYGSWLLLARQPSDALFLAWMYLAAVLGATALAGVMGAVLSRRLTHWAVGALTELERAIEASPPDAAALAPDGYADVSEIRAVRAALDRQMQRSHELLQEARRFASNAAHELRNPLATLRAELELAEEMANATDAEVLTRTRRRVEHLSSLVERLLVLTVRNEHAQPGFETVSSSEVLEAALERLEPGARSRVIAELADECFVRGDAALLAVLVDNVLGNALKFAPQHPIRVTVSHAAGGSLVRIVVEDRGPGVAPELRRMVFEPFFRGASEREGHGLGLALVSHVARLHGGRAQFEDIPVGTRLVVELPAWAPRAHG